MCITQPSIKIYKNRLFLKKSIKSPSLPKKIKNNPSTILSLNTFL